MAYYRFKTVRRGLNVQNQAVGVDERSENRVVELADYLHPAGGVELFIRRLATAAGLNPCIESESHQNNQKKGNHQSTHPELTS